MHTQSDLRALEAYQSSPEGMAAEYTHSLMTAVDGLVKSATDPTMRAYLANVEVFDITLAHQALGRLLRELLFKAEAA